MSKQQKRIEGLKNNPRDVRPEELEAVVVAAGFKPRMGKGDHRVYSKGDRRVTIDFGRSPCHPKSVKDVLEAIEE